MAPAAPSNYAGDQQPLPEKLREILGEHCQVQRVNKDRKIVGAASPEELGQSMENEQRRKFCENQLSQLGNDFDKVVQWVEAVKAKANALYYSSRYEPDRVQEHELVSDPASDEQAIALCSARPDGTTSPAACPSTSTSCASEDLSCDLAKLKEAALLYYDCLSGLEKCAKIIVAKGQYDEGSSSCSSTTETGGRTENEKTRNSYQQQIQLPITANLAACMLEMRHFRECIRLCDLALSVQPDHVKALVRRGIAYYKLREPGKAKVDLIRSLELLDIMDAATAGDTAGTGSAAATAGTAALSATTTENLRRRATVYLNWARKALQEDKERTRKMFNHRLYEEMQSLNYQESQQSRLVKDGNDHVRDENVVLQQEPKSAPSAGASSAAARTLLEEEGADEVDEPRPNKTESAVKNVCSKQDKEGAGNYSNTDDATSLSTTTRARRKDMCSTSDGASGTTFEKITIPKVKKKKELSFYADKPDVKMNQLSDEDIDRLIKEELEEIRSRTFFNSVVDVGGGEADSSAHRMPECAS